MSLSKTIKALFLFLFFATPLIYVSANSELFELPKMIFVYTTAIIIIYLHLLNHFHHQIPLFRPHPLNLYLNLFLISQTISTFFSIDLHTSLMGYYSRLNGGLYSLITYYLLFQVLNVYIDQKLIQKIINVSLLSGFFVAIFGIAQHFGIDAHLWVQDVRSRVFSTLGQPNWLAAYLCILIPLSFYKILSTLQNQYRQHIMLSLLSITYFTSLLFTKSKSGIIAVIISLIIFTLLYLIKSTSRNYLALISNLILLVSLSLIISNPIKDYIFPSQIIPTAKEEQGKIPTLNITPSEDIRKIVWQGAIKLWQQYPMFGTGPETFAYSYYWVRPAAHNLTSEWDFLYNKAHNEYLNYLATTGTFGLITYLLAILAFIFILLNNLIKKNSDHILTIAVISSYVSILITNTVGFSVVIVSLYFFLFPTFFPSSSPISTAKVSKFKWPLIIIISLITFKILSQTIYFYISDLTFSQAQKLHETSLLPARDQINISLSHFPNQATYLSLASSIYTNLSLSYHQQNDAANTSKYLSQAIQTSDQSVRLSPYNLNFWKIRAQNYYLLSTIDSKYFTDAIKSLAQVADLAPTDAKTFYTLARFFDTIEDTENAIKFYQEAINLKPNYDYAHFNLAKIYFNLKDYPMAQKYFEYTLKYAPTNPDAQNYLKQIKSINNQ